MPRPDWIEVGTIARAHGVRGEVRVTPSSDNPDRFLPGSVIHAHAPKPRGPERVALTVEDVRGSDAFLIVAFQEIRTRDDAEALRGAVLEIPGSDLPELEDDEFYPFDLVGLQVRTPAGESVGRVADAVESPAHALLVIALGRDGGDSEVVREVLVPFVAEAVPEVLVSQGYLVVEPRFLAEPETLVDMHRPEPTASDPAAP